MSQNVATEFGALSAQQFGCSWQSEAEPKNRYCLWAEQSHDMQVARDDSQQTTILHEYLSGALVWRLLIMFASDNL